LSLVHISVLLCWFNTFPSLASHDGPQVKISENFRENRRFEVCSSLGKLPEMSLDCYLGKT